MLACTTDLLTLPALNRDSVARSAPPAAAAGENVDPNIDPDAALVAAAQAGRRTACDALVERHQADLTRLLWRFARTHADLQDLVQETFLRMLRHLPAWRAERPFAHWLRHIAVNVGRDYHRRQNVRGRWQVAPRAPAPGEPRPAEPEALDPGADPAARAAANDVKSLLAQLPPDDRTLLTLQHLEGWPLARIAGELGWTVTATKLRAWRARHRLRALLTAHDLS